MKRFISSRIFGRVLLIAFFLITGCDKKKTADTGFLEGKISIGPICPVETIPPDPRCLPTAETYKAYPVTVWTSNGKTKILQLMPALDGSYQVELMSGNYLVVLDAKQGGPGGSNLPVEITISPAEKTILNINIDTGIR